MYEYDDTLLFRHVMLAYNTVCIHAETDLPQSVFVYVQLAEGRLREQWRLNCPELREMESQQMQQSAQDEWENQIQRKQQVCV